MKSKKTLIKYAGNVLIIILSLLFLYVGNKMSSEGLTIFDRESSVLTTEAKIIRIIAEPETDPRLSGRYFSDTDIVFEARITGGEYKNKTAVAVQSVSIYQTNTVRGVREGDKIILTTLSEEPGADDSLWYFVNFIRIDKILMLAGAFALLLLIFGRIKGLNAILALGFTCVAIFAVFIPSILAGGNIYLSSIVVSIFSIVSTLLIVNGFNQKSAAAVAGCLGGVIVIALLTFLMSGALGLTGITTEESRYLLYLPIETAIDLKAIIFAGIIFGAIGAIMDVAMSISSALWELKSQVPDLGFSRILKSGINIGRDIIGTMVNTLILAYIGSSLTVVLLLFYYTNSFIELINRELVIVELLQSIAGSLGVLLTMPLTALISAALYSRIRPKKGSETETEAQLK